MANRLLFGSMSKPVAKRHGKSGNVGLHVTVDPSLKSALVRRARRRGTSLNDEVREALEQYIAEDPSDLAAKLEP
jgi:predicted HicB family RNase H-like nuclease